MPIERVTGTVSSAAGGTSGPPGLWRRRYRDLTNRKLLYRRLAFLAEAIDQRVALLRTPRERPVRRGGDHPELEDARLVIAITHWRYAERWRPWDDDEILLTCVRRLIVIPAASVHVIILTNDAPSTQRVLDRASTGDDGPLATAIASGHDWERALGRGGPSVTVLQPRLRWPRHTGPYLTWSHKPIMRRALREPAITHLIYLEDDIGLTEDNLRYWMQARPALEPLGLIPGFLLFEQHRGERYLIQQTESGQHRTVAGPIEVPSLGPVSLSRADLPYHASYVMDRALAIEHFARSAFRSPFRSRVAGWGVHERAAAGPLFEPTRTPLRNFARLGSAPYLPPARNAIPLRRSAEATSSVEVVEGALLEHLRTTYSTDPDRPHGKLPVRNF